MFFVFPLNSRPDWRKPPIFTLLITLINCIVFFGPQARDEDRADRAAEFYLKSSLPRIRAFYCAAPVFGAALQAAAGVSRPRI